MNKNKTWRKAFMVLLACAVLTLPVYSQMPESEINIEFAAGNEPVDPVDPDNPSEPLQPPGGGTGEAGPLTLNYISPIDFGTRTISSALQDYPALTLKPFIQVTDLRGTGEGWYVEATAGPFTNGTVQTLPGSRISFLGGAAISANTDLTPPSPVSSVSLPTDGLTARKFVTAYQDTGLGTWVIRWYPTLPGATENDNVTLTVQAGTASLDMHQSTIIWRLVDAP